MFPPPSRFLSTETKVIGSSTVVSSLVIIRDCPGADVPLFRIISFGTANPYPAAPIFSMSSVRISISDDAHRPSISALLLLQLLPQLTYWCTTEPQNKLPHLPLPIHLIQPLLHISSQHNPRLYFQNPTQPQLHDYPLIWYSHLDPINKYVSPGALQAFHYRPAFVARLRLESNFYIPCIFLSVSKIRYSRLILHSKFYLFLFIFSTS